MGALEQRVVEVMERWDVPQGKLCTAEHVLLPHTIYPGGTGAESAWMYTKQLGLGFSGGYLLGRVLQKDAWSWGKWGAGLAVAASAALRLWALSRVDEIREPPEELEALPEGVKAITGVAVTLKNPRRRRK